MRVVCRDIHNSLDVTTWVVSFETAIFFDLEDRHCPVYPGNLEPIIAHS